MKILYHYGTGTWFDLDDNVYLIDLDEIALDDDDELSDLLDEAGQEIALGFGKPLSIKEDD